MICLIALAVFSILGIFSAKYRVYAKEAFSCVFRRITLRPCTTDFDQQMKMKVVSKMFTRSPKAAGFMYRHFETISWIFTAIMVISLAYSGMAIYSLTVYGTCDPSNPNNCVFRLGGPECAPNAQPNADIASFTDSGSAVCTEGGKPVVLMFSATWCPHCNWVSPAFEKVAKEYVDRIVARHWQLDISDDTLTSAIETGIPQADKDMFAKYSDGGNVPTFVFGCRYYRVGNAHEAQKDLTAEEADFRAAIEALIK